MSSHNECQDMSHLSHNGSLFQSNSHVQNNFYGEFSYGTPQISTCRPEQFVHIFRLSSNPETNDICLELDEEEGKPGGDRDKWIDDDFGRYTSKYPCGIWHEGPQAEDSTYPDGMTCDGHIQEAPSLYSAKLAVDDLKPILRPPRKTGPGYIDPELDHFVQIRIEGMQGFLNLYTDQKSATYGKWGPSAFQAAILQGHGRYCA